MANYAALFVSGGASPAGDDQDIIDAIEAFTKDTWTVTFRDESGSKDPAGFDVVVFSETETGNTNWTTWSSVDIPQVVPANRFDQGNERLFNAAASRVGGGAATIDGQVKSGASHPILDDSGFTSGTVTGWHDGNRTVFQSASDAASGTEILIEKSGDATSVVMAVADTGATMDNGTATNRRIAISTPTRLGTNGLTIFESGMRWLAGALDATGDVAELYDGTSWITGITEVYNGSTWETFTVDIVE